MIAVVKLPSLAWLLAALPLLTGCETYYTQLWATTPRGAQVASSATFYTRLRITNPRGELIADWVARGPVWHVEAGYRITAVERTEGCPYPHTARYPDGWSTTVVGPNIRRWRCAKPAWLAEESGN